MSKLEEMKKIEKKLLNLRKSPLYEYRKENDYLPVIGQGRLGSKIVFIGEAPGKNEAKTGKPFCGASGKILDELLNHIKLERSDVYVTNIVKDRPQENRDPSPEEIRAYGPLLDAQLEIIKPKVIATLGRFSMEYIMKSFGLEKDLKVISKMHGKKFTVKTYWGNTLIIPLYHPAVAIYNRKKLPELKKDFKILSLYS